MNIVQFIFHFSKRKDGVSVNRYCWTNVNSSASMETLSGLFVFTVKNQTLSAFNSRGI